MIRFRTNESVRKFDSAQDDTLGVFFSLLSFFLLRTVNLHSKYGRTVPAVEQGKTERFPLCVILSGVEVLVRESFP